MGNLSPDFWAKMENSILTAVFSNITQVILKMSENWLILLSGDPWAAHI